MTNLEIFDKALKISWIKRLQNEKEGWEYLPRRLNIHKIILFGDKYPQKLLPNIDNPFWKNVVEACGHLQAKLTNVHKNTYNIPLWFNSRMNLGFKKNWFQKGYSKVSDILDSACVLQTREKLAGEGIHINFLEYETLRFDIDKLNIVKHKADMHGPYLPYFLFEIGYNIKGCAKTYSLLMGSNSNIITGVQRKWEERLGEDMPYQTVKNSFRDIRKMKEGPYMKYVQFKMLHGRIITNKKLLDMGISDSSKCPYCDEPEETIEHAFIYCTAIVKFWKDIEHWLRRYIEGTITISNIEKIMGTGNMNNIIEKTITATKGIIYKNRQIGKNYNINEVKSSLRSQMLMEEYQAGLEGNDESFLKTWERIYRYIK